MADRIVVMNAGRVEQVGTPLELYDRPANLFVAGFIGSPSMNFISGTLSHEDAGSVVVTAEGTRLPAPRGLGRHGQSVVYGVRPEHLTLAGQDSNVGGVIEVVEPTGANIEVVAMMAGERVCAVFNERHPFRPGETIGFSIAPEKVHLFDARSGTRLER